MVQGNVVMKDGKEQVWESCGSGHFPLIIVNWSERRHGLSFHWMIKFLSHQIASQQLSDDLIRERLFHRQQVSGPLGKSWPLSTSSHKSMKDKREEFREDCSRVHFFFFQAERFIFNNIVDVFFSNTFGGIIALPNGPLISNSVTSDKNPLHP